MGQIAVAGGLRNAWARSPMNLTISASWAAVSAALARIANLTRLAHRCDVLAPSLISKKPVLRSRLACSRMAVSTWLSNSAAFRPRLLSAFKPNRAALGRANTCHVQRMQRHMRPLSLTRSFIS
jgi:hypothetical protein